MLCQRFSLCEQWKRVWQILCVKSFCRDGFVGHMLCTTSMLQGYVVHHQPPLCTMDIFHCLVVHMKHAQNRHFLSVFGGGTLAYRCIDSGHTRVVHKGTDTQYSILVVHNVHADQGSQCSSIQTYTLVVHKCRCVLIRWCTLWTIEILYSTLNKMLVEVDRSWSNGS